MRNDVSVVMTVLSVDPDCVPEIAGMIGASMAVSYTHLDVYKRQVCGNFSLPEPASYVFFYALFNLRKLLYLIGPVLLA